VRDGYGIVTRLVVARFFRRMTRVTLGMIARSRIPLHDGCDVSRDAVALICLARRTRNWMMDLRQLLADGDRPCYRSGNEAVDRQHKPANRSKYGVRDGREECLV
jgi:hypothetical protein